LFSMPKLFSLNVSCTLILLNHGFCSLLFH
jgi:hypothetical protein